MPLIIFVGIASLGALFLMVFFAKLWREERHRGHGIAVRRARPAVRLGSQTVPGRHKPSGMVVLRRTIEYRGGGAAHKRSRKANKSRVS